MCLCGEKKLTHRNIGNIEVTNSGDKLCANVVKKKLTHRNIGSIEST